VSGQRQSVRVDWTRDEVLAAVRASVPGRVDSGWTFERTDLDGDQVLVLFRVGAQRFGVHYSLDELPDGPNTAEPCDTPREWAQEIGWDMDEQVLTGGLLRAERTAGSDGVILLSWRP
jgi:hypothetical protein